MKLEIQYRLTGTGWAECALIKESQSVLITASYLSDALGDLAEAVLNALKGNVLSICYFEEEPGRYRWIFEKRDSSIHIEVGTIAGPSGEEWLGERVDPFEDEYCYDILFETDCTKAALKSAFVTCLEDVLNKYGKDGYLEKWVDDPFPETILHNLVELNIG